MVAIKMQNKKDTLWHISRQLNSMKTILQVFSFTQNTTNLDVNPNQGLCRFIVELFECDPAIFTSVSAFDCMF